MTAATIAPPPTVVTTEYQQQPSHQQQQQQQQQREPEVLTRRSPSVRSSNHESKRLSLSSRDPSSLQRHGSTQSQTSSLDNKKRRSQESLVSRRQSERRKPIRIQNYIINRKTIGAGSMGKVKLAECLTDTDRQQYAVKIMPKVNLAAMSDANSNKAKDPKDTPKEREQRTVREMAMMQLLRHPNICQLKEWINEGDYYYMFLEYVDGGQLLDYIISHGKLREKQARKFARQIVSALDYCHRNSIVHRDLKIENILITRDEDIKIIDFGLSNIYSPSRLLSTFCGSLYFAAPELLQARHYTGPEVDVWSFGVVLYVLVCGRVPFDDTSLPALHAKIKAGQVDGYPDHLSKDCVDLLTKILVVDPKRRATLSQVRSHPWMNKGHDDPIQNHIPHRQALDSIDMDIVAGMGGFGFGEPKDIYTKLESLIAKSEYRNAASQIDHNYQQNLLNQGYSSKPRWRRSLKSKRSSQVQDDPQSLPAMYEPLVSIYYLAKEKKEYDNRQRQLKRAQMTSAQSTPILRRSNSTIATSTTSRIEAGGGLTRRKTDRTPSTPKLTGTSGNANHQSTNNNASSNVTRSGSVNFPTRSNSMRGASSALLARSKSAARKIGAMLPNTNIQRHSFVEDSPDKALPPLPSSQANDDSSHKNNDSSTGAVPEPKPVASLSTPLKKTFQQLLKVDNKDGTDKQRPSWRRLSISRPSKYSRASMEAASAVEPMPPPPAQSKSAAASNGRVSESVDTRDTDIGPMPKLGAHPKSLFNFNRRHLFRSTPQKLMDDLNDLLWLMNIRTQQSVLEPFVLDCECDYPDWLKFLTKPSDSDSGQSSHIETGPGADSDLEGEPLRFTVMIYQARWAGGRLGVKVKEAEDETTSNGTSKIYRNLYHTILCELGKVAGRTQA
ncbi:kinase-like domain-containing protein [Phascolomyces articulosus]|uniref:non-specific serine/threonine protein kinase n=1 Tax=Phascolomyces articulosus TaxID=60185 RepID=A0AAD5JUU5_9FUNG|nr:kinase-like domain-containing protein [Phascolomyces articulosus]